MAEFGELLPGTKWRAVGGNKVEILSHHLIPTRVTRPDGTSYEATMRGNDPEAVAKWVRWVEPIAVGDRVRVPILTSSTPGPHEVLATFRNPNGGHEIAVVAFEKSWAFVAVSEVKVNDE